MKKIAESGNQTGYVSGKNSYYRINVNQILYVEVMSHTVTYHMPSGELCVHGSLREAYRDLPKDRFIKSSQSYIVNLAYTEVVNTSLLLINGNRIPLSRSFRHDFFKRMEEYRTQRSGAQIKSAYLANISVK